MLYYNPNNGECLSEKIIFQPRTCFLMSKLGDDVPDEIGEIRAKLDKIFTRHGYKLVDAESKVTGRDFLEKIWKMIVQIPVGICIVDKSMSVKTYANIFYELGLMQAYGKETIVIKTNDAEIPSDFIRTEYIAYNRSFTAKVEKFIKHLFYMSEHYRMMADQLEKNPLLFIDYLRRAYLLSGNEDLLLEARNVVKGLDLSGRAKNSVEMLHAAFCRLTEES